MKVAVIGAGFTGLAAALKIIKAGHNVTIFEKESIPGGLAVGLKESKWQWGLEKYYHHWFSSDNQILSLAKELKYEVIIKRPKTSVYVNDNIYQLDSPTNILKFPEISLLQRLRMGLTLGLLRYNPFWKPLEGFKVSAILPKIMGKEPYQMLWEPLLDKKFGEFSQNISLAWFWARIAKRTPFLAYPKGGFSDFANVLVSEIQKKGGKFFFKSEIKEIKSEKKGTVSLGNLTLQFDKIIVTLPSFLFAKIAGQLPENYKQKLLNLKGLSAINLVLRLNKPFLRDGTYWLNICDKKYPLTAIVEHTNFMNKRYYNNEHLVYLGNYLPFDNPFMKMGKEELLKIYDPLLRKINRGYRSTIIGSKIFTAPFAQPIIPTNYSRIKPPFETPLRNIYLANIQQVYPEDRGTNYAMRLGEEVADIILSSPQYT